MSDGESDEHGERIVSVFAPESDPDRFVANLLDDDRTTMADCASAVAGSNLVVALGERALPALAAAGVSTPVLSIPTSTEALRSVPEALDRFFDGDEDVEKRPVVCVETPDATAHALRDVSLTAATPGMISEFTVETAGPTGTGTEERIARVRADGVVVATPAGSRGYARAAGGPVVAAGSDVVAVVPIAPFATDPDHWILPLSSFSITIERDVDVSVTVDGRPVATLASDTRVRFARVGTLRLIAAALDGP